MEDRKTSAQLETAPPKLDLSGLLGAGRVFDPTGDGTWRPELTDIGCNRVGGETSPPPP